MSIGYRVAPGGSRYENGTKGQRCRRLKQLELSEVSLVDDPMNPMAKFNFVKSAGGNAELNPRELEKGLRDVGLSRSDAKTAVGCLQKMLRRDAGEADIDVLRDEGTAAKVLQQHMEQRFMALAKLIK